MSKKSENTNTDEFKVELRPYQSRDAEDIEDRWSGDNAILYQLPTGGGKSVVATKVLFDHRDEKTLVLAHRKELLVQMRGHLQNQGLKVGLIIRDRHEDLDANIIIASISTVSRDNRLDMILKQKFDNIVVDEAHRILTNSYDKVISQLQEQNSELKLLGLTATPTRRDKKSFADLFSTLIASESVQSLIDQGYLANYRTFYTPVKDLDEEVQKYFNDYKLSDLSKYMRKPEMVQYAVKSYKELGEDRQTLVFCVDRAHAQDIEAAYKDAGYDKVGYIDGKTPEKKREQILKDYEAKKLTHIVSIETMTEGVDLPETGCIQLLRPTLSLTLYLQMVGRGLRPKKDGSDLIILDNAGCATQFGVASSPKKWSLNPKEDPNEGRKRNKVVGKRKDGTLTDDEDEMEFTELVEMSPEEFAAQVSNSIEVAEKKNKELDEKTAVVLKAIADMFIEKLDDSEDWEYVKPNTNWSVDEDKFTIINKKKQLKGKSERYAPEIKFHLDSSEDDLIFLSREATYYNYAEYRDLISYTQQVIGKLWAMLDKKKFANKVAKEWKSLQTEMGEIKDKKVDLNELRRLIREAKGEQFERDIAKHFETSNEFILPNNLYAGHYFRDYYGRIEKIEIPKGKIVGHHNTIILHTVENVWHKDEPVRRARTKDYVKGEKVYELLKNGEWTLEVKKLEEAK